MAKSRAKKPKDFGAGAVPITRDYQPHAYGSGWYGLRRRAPLFSLSAIGEMLTDPRVQFALRLVKGPVLSKARFFVDCDHAEAKEFLVDTITRFWRTSAGRALKAIEWGFSCSEVLYEVHEGRIRFEGLKDLHSMDCRVWIQNGQLDGASVRNLPGVNRNTPAIRVPRLLWHVHDREKQPWYGRSRLYGAYLPWIEKWSDGGYRDIRTLFYHKCAFEGGIFYHPPGSDKLDDGSEVSNKDLAREMLEKKKTGGVMALPNTTDGEGNRKWVYEPPHVLSEPGGMLEYGRDLDDEIAEGIGVPSEVLKAEGTGAYAGRQIPMEAFYAMLQEVMYWLMTDFDQQVLRQLVAVNFGQELQFEVVPFGLLTPSVEQQQVETERASPQAVPGMEMSLDTILEQPRYNVEVVSDVPPVGYLPKYGGRGISFSHSESGKGRWVTMNGARVFIEDGKITKGPKALVGKAAGDAGGGLPKRTVNTMSDAIAQSSPSGRTSKRAVRAARKKLSKDLFGSGGLPGARGPDQSSEVDYLLKKAKELRTFAERGLRPRTNLKEAKRLEAQAAELGDAGGSGGAADSSPKRPPAGHEMTRGEYEDYLSQIEPLPNKMFKASGTLVHQNPSYSDTQVMIQDVKREFPWMPRGEPKIRTTRDERGNKWVWKSHQGTHLQIEPTISRRVGVDVDQNFEVPRHSDLVRKAIREKQLVPEHVQAEYPRWKDRFQYANRNIG